MSIMNRKIAFSPLLESEINSGAEQCGDHLRSQKIAAVASNRGRRQKLGTGPVLFAYVSAAVYTCLRCVTEERHRM